MFLSLEVLTAASGEPVSLARAKRHLRVDHADDDADITDMISEARQEAENWLSRPIRSATYRAMFKDWSVPFVIAQQGPVLVTEIDYLNASSVRTIVPSAQYQSGHGHQGQVICPVDAWPTDGAADPMPRISFQVGFAEVPPVINRAILLGVQFMYDNRGSMQLTNQKFEDSQAWYNLLWPYRVVGV